MRQLILLSFALIVAIGAITACNSNETVHEPAAQVFMGADGAQRITVAALHDLWQNGQVYLVDTRGEAGFKTSHIPGAVPITQAEITSKVSTAPALVCSDGQVQ